MQGLKIHDYQVSPGEKCIDFLYKNQFCEFYFSAAGEALAAQYWAITGGFRFFEYLPGSEPVIDPGYENKIVGYQTGM